MAGVNLQWRIETERLERALQALADRAATPARVRGIGEDLLLSHRDRFDAQESRKANRGAPERGLPQTEEAPQG
ncbi:phage virion morphogenesis protein [Marinobacter subterrani]|uniref:Uncharacterized protein n=1 Tax=Marinobacter subterrani TaxID=1658765 RepID=A0A0J7JFQ6_9GAMM|nr:hypothetical protein [Marinobacter subterrani]KMQ77012.1 hypothetical protein Msub_13227 [Marinobacter subterrani]